MRALIAIGGVCGLVAFQIGAVMLYCSIRAGGFRVWWRMTAAEQAEAFGRKR